MIPWPGHDIPLSISIDPKTEIDLQKQLEVIQYYRVNFSALGSIPSDLARRYADAITKAADEADRLTNEYKDKPWE